MAISFTALQAACAAMSFDERIASPEKWFTETANVASFFRYHEAKTDRARAKQILAKGGLSPETVELYNRVVAWTEAHMLLHLNK